MARQVKGEYRRVSRTFSLDEDIALALDNLGPVRNDILCSILRHPENWRRISEDTWESAMEDSKERDKERALESTKDFLEWVAVNFPSLWELMDREVGSHE